MATGPARRAKRARNYYPVIAVGGGRQQVFIRTNAAHSMAQRIAADRGVLCRNAGVDDRDWRAFDRWLKNEAAQGNEALWQREQTAVTQFLAGNPSARTFFVFDAATGEPAAITPILWAVGCQGVGAPLVWLWQPNCWIGAEVRRAEFQGTTMHYTAVPTGEDGDVLVIPKAATDLQASRDEPHADVCIINPFWKTRTCDGGDVKRKPRREHPYG